MHMRQKVAFLERMEGMAVDEEMHVLSPQGRIPGLYAAGEVAGRFHGANYHTGTSIRKSIIFDRIAGRNAAQGI
jgi:fumarate reductase flavoprotein subunit